MVNVLTANGTLMGGPAQAMRRMLFQGARVLDPAPRSPLKVESGRRVRVLAVVHGWFPALAAGSERMMQHLLDALPRDEFEVEILSFGMGDGHTLESSYTYQGTRVTRGFDSPIIPDLIILHHGYAARTLPSFSEQYPNAAVVVVHHNERYDTEDLLSIRAELNVYNTNWVKKALGTNGIVVHPPLEYDRHHVAETGEAVTLVNLQLNKGFKTWNELGLRMSPEFPFLGVIGTHGEQLAPHETHVQVHPVTQDMREVWAQTKVLLMPSEYESYGMCAAEALISGIPVIAHPTPGLVECLGSAGIFIDRDDVDGYERALRALLTDPDLYEAESLDARERGAVLVAQTEKELRKFVNAVRKVVR